MPQAGPFEDDAAEQATSFYVSLHRSRRVARTAAWNANRQGDTWAAYQCYGDPEWTGVEKAIGYRVASVDGTGVGDDCDQQ